MAEAEPVHEINPSETYQIDSSNYDSDEEREALSDGEYEKLAEESENAFTEEERETLIADLKEKGIISFLRSYLASGANGEMASLRRLLIGLGIVPPKHLRDPSTPNEQLLPITKVALSRILRRREKLPQYNTVQDAVDLLRKSRRIIVLSGAGISTSCGIPDFRSANGLYAGLQREGRFDLDDPQQMFDIRYFVEHPEVFYSFAKQIYPSNFIPSPCHRWIKSLEDKGVLLRNYTQNIDTLESLAGVQNVLQCHGSFKTASCLRCKTRVPGQTIEPYIMSSQIPYCGTCRKERDEEIQRIKANRDDARRKQKGKGKERAWIDDSDSDDDISEWGGGLPGIIKPDITFFGQALDSSFDQCLYKDREEVDLLVIIGTSLKVAPVSEVLTHIPHSVPQMFINLTPVYHVRPDICLLGDADSIVTYLSDQLGWTIPPPAAVAHSPKAEMKAEVDGDEVGKPRSSSAAVKIPPDQVVWHTMPGEEHIHVLGYVGDGVESGGVEADDDSSASEDASPIVARLDIEDQVPEQVHFTGSIHRKEEEDKTQDEAQEGSDDGERPSKRHRASDS